MPTVTSADGTTIAYESTGSGPAVILVDGAMCFRGGGPMRPLAAKLTDHFTVVIYDRRGRGESSDTQPFTVAREVEDLRALIGAAGGRAYLYAMSSGAGVALATAAADPGVTKLALYEPPFLAEVEGTVRTGPYTERLTGLLAAGRHDEAVSHFLRFVGLPEAAVDGMRHQPGWGTMTALAPTLAYDDAGMTGGRVPPDLAARVSVPVLVLTGDASPADLQLTAKATATALPTAQLQTLADQTHDVDPSALAPALIDFFVD